MTRNEYGCLNVDCYILIRHPSYKSCKPMRLARLCNIFNNSVSQSQVKGLSIEELSTRNDLVLALSERIQAIPDGSMEGAKQTANWTASTSHKNIKFDSSGNQCYTSVQGSSNESLSIPIFQLHCFTSITDGKFDDGFFQESEQSSQFRQEYEMRRLKQASNMSDLCLVWDFWVIGAWSPTALHFI